MTLVLTFGVKPVQAATVTWDGRVFKVQQTITGTLTINSGGNLTHNTANTMTNLYNEYALSKQYYRNL